jgi:hypothetical protein
MAFLACFLGVALLVSGWRMWAENGSFVGLLAAFAGAVVILKTLGRLILAAFQIPPKVGK